jgi:protocatechuate 3,4-dioxygenase beta subunit
MRMKLALRTLFFAGMVVLSGCEARRAGEGPVSTSTRGLAGQVTVHGTVSDNQGQPVGGATIAFQSGGADAGATQTTAGSDAGLDGTYSINIAPGTYAVVVTPPSSSPLRPITLTGQEFSSDLRFDVVLSPESVVLSGHVRDQSGAPMAGVSVRLTVGGMGSSVSTTTDSSGFYQLGVSPGDYRLNLSGSLCVVTSPDAAAPGIDAASTRSCSVYYSIGMFGGGYAVHVEDSTVFDVTLPSPKTLSGQVLDENDNPIAGVSVAQSGSWSITLPGTGGDAGGPTETSQMFSSVATDATGRFQFRLLPGIGQLVASVAGGASVSTLVTLVEDTEVTIRFAPTATVSGHVLYQSGDPPVPGANVNLGMYGPPSAVTDATGFYELGLVPGDYTLSVSGSECVLVYPDAGSSPAQDAGAPRADAAPINSCSFSYRIDGYAVRVDGPTTFNVTLPSPKTLTGRVLDVDGNPVVGAQVGQSGGWPIAMPDMEDDAATGAIYGSLSFSTTTTDGDGRFQFRLLPGSGGLMASIPGRPSAYASVTLVEDTDDVTIQFAPTVTVSGNVLYQSGDPAVGVSVRLWEQAPLGGTPTAVTDASGHYQVDVVPGDFKMAFSGSLCLSANQDAGAPGIDAGRTVRPPPSPCSFYEFWKDDLVHVAGPTIVDLGLPTPRTLEGQVVDVDGTNPIAGASVDGSFGSQRLSGAITDGNGRFQFRLLPGSGTLTVSPIGSPWLAPATAPVNNLTEDTRIVIAVQFLSDSASGDVTAGGTLTTDRSGAGATSTDPVATTVQIPEGGTGGEVVIDESPITQAPAEPGAWVFLTQQVTIEAPDATVENPLVLTFLLDGSRLLPGETASDVHMFRDGVLVPACNNPEAGVAVPAPCVSQQGMAGDDVRIVVLTDHASNWNFGIRAADMGGSGGASGSAGGTSGGAGTTGTTGAGGSGTAGTPGTVVVPWGAGGSAGTGPSGGAAGTAGSGGAAGATVPPSGSGGAGPSGNGGAVAVSADASIDASTPDVQQTRAIDAEDAPTEDVARDGSGSDLDGAAPPAPGLDGAPATAADAGPAVEVAGALDGAASLDAYSSGGGVDGGLDGPAASNGSDEGCGCHLAAPGSQLPGTWAAALAACLALLMRRRRR